VPPFPRYDAHYPKLPKSHFAAWREELFNDAPSRVERLAGIRLTDVLAVQKSIRCFSNRMCDLNHAVVEHSVSPRFGDQRFELGRVPRVTLRS
jgi:hypothetical protein